MLDLASQHHQTMSAEIISSNTDLLIEILSYLQTKPLLRLTLISKSFHSLITSNTHLHLLHTRRHPYPRATALFLLHHHLNNPTFNFIPLSPPPQSPPTIPFNLHILQSSNGLLLCSPCIVFNPTTLRTLDVPLPRKGFLGVSLAFDPKRLDLFGFWVVCVWKIDDGCFAIDLYESRLRKWRPFIDLFKAPFDVEFDRGVYFDGGVYWLSHTGCSVMLDLVNGCVSELRLPDDVDGEYMERFRYFGESCGHLHLVEIRTNCVSNFDVLELDRKEKNEWFVKFRVDLDVLGRGFEDEMFQDHCDRFNRRFRFYAFSILAIVRGNVGDDVNDGDEIVVSIPGKVISYNFKTMVSKLLENVGDVSDRWLPFKGYNAYQFIESLYPL